MTHPAAPPPRPGAPSSFQRLGTDPTVRELRVRRQPVIGAAAAVIALYLFNAVLATKAPGVLAVSLAGPLNLGFALGLLQCVTTLGCAAWYARYARTRIDPLRVYAAAVIEWEEERS